MSLSPPASESATESFLRPRTSSTTFVTVGSTRFDTLVQAVLSDSVLDALRSRGYSRLVVQSGNSDFDASSFEASGEGLTRTAADGIDIEVWKFRPSLQEEYEQAGLIISHAGSGTILDVLRLGKPLIVVPNPTLLDNHQQELADALAALGHLQSSTVSTLSETIQGLTNVKLVPFPPFNGSRFRELLDDEMGYSESEAQ
ncbi:uncharacterized protein FIBRA_04495 [Fibroporia radiculosa]|uniref:UDP-N-acetylglucosamine transferase subunit ALG13 n=1 Tax=Fibroporia radiculosa TaxID=599839 RepID=J4HWK0_9APHY|nr:uncharacterized protein FIBRA_04495 [Fibroporia radiculosa]CCM02397.1 predicted protein [Fibroporia radiculosa]